jgi:hypothetical protein
MTAHQLGKGGLAPGPSAFYQLGVKLALAPFWIGHAQQCRRGASGLAGRAIR